MGPARSTPSGKEARGDGGKPSTMSNACRDCLQKCCSFPARKASPEAFLSLKDIGRIERVTGRSDFYEEKDSSYANRTYYRLKSTADGFCVFYDTEHGACTIYDVRPFDCRLFPLDFESFHPGDPDWNDMWIVHECPLSEQLDAATLEEMMTDFETNHAQDIFDIAYSGQESLVGLKGTGAFRILREMEIDDEDGAEDDSTIGTSARETPGLQSSRQGSGQLHTRTEEPGRLWIGEHEFETDAFSLALRVFGEQPL